MQGCWVAVLVLAGFGLVSATALGKLLPYGDDDGEGLLLASDVGRGPPLTPQEEDADARMKVAEFVREVKRVLSGVRRRTSQSLQLEKRLEQQRAGKVNKRHCWDVADVCCMWNIC